MAKETKQDRIVRGMLDQVIEHVHEFNNLDKTPTTKELDLNGGVRVYFGAVWVSRQARATQFELKKQRVNRDLT